MYREEFSSLQLPVAWTSVCLGFNALRPYIAIRYIFSLVLFRLHTSVHTARMTDYLLVFLIVVPS